jgi:hypothetical protein
MGRVVPENGLCVYCGKLLRHSNATRCRRCFRRGRVPNDRKSERISPWRMMPDGVMQRFIGDLGTGDANISLRQATAPTKSHDAQDKCPDLFLGWGAGEEAGAMVLVEERHCSTKAALRIVQNLAANSIELRH